MRVRPVEYHGWKRSVEIRNAEARVVVVPEVGRILYYGLMDGVNVLYEDESLAGQTLPLGRFARENGEPVWLNFGGDKVWPSEQSRWPETNAVAWPPDPWFDGGLHSAKLLPDGVEIASAVSGFNGARIVRSVRLAATGTRLTIDQRLEKVRPGKNTTAERVPFTVWSVTQIRPPALALLPVAAASAFPNRWYDCLVENRSCAANVAVAGDVAAFRPALDRSQKIGVDAGPWLAAIVDDLLLVEVFYRDPAARYPDGGLSATVFTCPKYAELEIMSPLATLPIGSAIEFPIIWELHPLPGAGATAADRCAAALGILQQHAE